MAKEKKDRGAFGFLGDIAGGIGEFLTTPQARSAEANIAARQLQNDQARLANALQQLKVIALTNPDNQTANAQANEIFKSAGLPIQEGADFGPFLDKFRSSGRTAQQATQIAQAAPAEVGIEVPFGPEGRGRIKRTAQQSSEDIATTLSNINTALGPGSRFEVDNINVSDDGGFNIKLGQKTPQQELINQLVLTTGPSIVAGTATPEQIQQFNQAISALSGRASTNITINTGDTTPEGVADTLGKFKEGQAELESFVDDPVNETFVDNMDFSIETNTKGFLETVIKPKKTIGSEAIAKREIIEDVAGRLGRIGEIMKDPGFFSKVGPVEGRITEIKAKLVGGDPTGAELRRLLDSLIIWVYGLSGKAITEPERLLLKSLQPQITDPDDTFVSNFFGYLEDIKFASGASDELWQELGFRSTGQKPRQEVQKAISGFRGEDGRTAKDLTKEELEKIAGGE